MNKYDLFHLVRDHILESPGFRDVPHFPSSLQSLENVEQLLWWLATTDFSSSSDGLWTAIDELIRIISMLDSSGEKLLKLLRWVVNKDTTGLLFISIDVVTLCLRDKEYEQARQSTAQAVESLVRQQPDARSYIAGWLIHEFDLGYHPDLPLTDFSDTIKHNYQKEFGHPISIDMEMIIGLATRDLGEKERLNKVVVLAMNHMFPNVSSLAIVWLVQAHAEDPFLKKTLKKIQHLTLKQIWNGAQFNTFTTNPSKVLLAGNTYQDSFGDIEPANG